MALLELDHISYSYGDIPALKDLSFCFEKGHTYCLEGPNGCGKSTLFRILTGLSFPDSGKYIFEGTEITEKKMKDPEFSGNFHFRQGVLLQNSDVQLFTGSVEDEIQFGLLNQGLDRRVCQERTEKYLDLLNLQKLRKRAPFHLSGGEKKKVALAAVLAMEPDVFILDEPLNGLDEETRENVTGVIQNLRSPEHLVLVASHDRDFMTEVADRRVFMEDGHIRQDEEIN